jgi:hypothetical protein
MVIDEQLGSEDRTDGAARLAARALKRREVVRADEHRRGLPHRVQIQWLREVPHIRAIERR